MMCFQLAVSRRTCALGALLLATAFSTLAPATAGEGTSRVAPETASAVWPIHELRTSFALRTDLLEDWGVRVEGLQATAPALDHHPLSVSAGTDVAFQALVGPSLGLIVEKDTPRGFSGSVRHQGGFDFVWSGGRASLQAFGLRGGERRLSLQVVDAAGDVLLIGDHMHFEVDREAGRLRAFNMDLRVTPALAERIGEPLLSGEAIGILNFEARVDVPAPQTAARSAEKGNPCSDWSGTVDVSLVNISSVSRRVQQGNMVAMAPSAELKNVGTANVPWRAKFTGVFPPYNTDQHPFLVWSFNRILDGRLEQLAVSDVKHAFLTLNTNCDAGACTDSHILGLGCEDVYGSGTNDSNGSLSYRGELEAGPGLWEDVGSHFDPNSTGSQTHPPSSPDGAFAHRTWVNTSELGIAGATYFIEAWYVVRDDVNIFNSMGWRQLNPSSSGGTWSFPNAGSYNLGSVLDAWVDPDTPPAGSMNTTVDVGSDQVQLAVKTEDIGGEQTRFEYVLRNHDYDEQIEAFSVPLGESLVVDTAFRDLDDDLSNDWVATVADGKVTWRLPAGATGSPRHNGGVALDWGLAYNFTLEVIGTPTTGNAEAEPYSGTKGFGPIAITTLVPGSSTVLFADGFESGDMSAWTVR